MINERPKSESSIFYDPLDYCQEINSIDNTRSIFYVAFYIEIDKC